MKSMTINGSQGRLAAVESGSGAGIPVVFLHADSGRASQWEAVRSRFGKGRRAVAVDTRGSGNSDAARDGNYSYEARAQDIADVVKTFGFDRIVIVAHSGSGPAALRYAGDHGDAVAGLLLVDAPTDPRALPLQVKNQFLEDLAGPKSLEVQKAFYASIAGTDAAVRARVLTDCEATTAEARLGFATALAFWDPEPALRGWHGPTLILASAPNDNEHALYRLAPDIPHEVIGDAGHWLQLDQPKRVGDAILGFIGRLEAGTN